MSQIILVCLKKLYYLRGYGFCSSIHLLLLEGKKVQNVFFSHLVSAD